MQRAPTAAILATFAMSIASLSTAALRADPVVINEIHYMAPDKTVHDEFVELYNSGEGPVDISGWFFSQGIDYTFEPGTVLGPGEFLVVAEDPPVVRSIYGGGIPVVGPYSGRLASDGEELELRNPFGEREDRVDYRNGFPWPTVERETGLSIELVHPSLDNELGGSWRLADPGAVSNSNTIVGDGEVWRYRDGSTEASTPRSAWRQRSFGDTSWESGRLSIGYGENFIRTSLDMRSNYVSVFLRKEFEIADAAEIRSLVLEVQFDDGFNAWINGVHVAGDNMPSNDPAFDVSANSALENLDFVRYSLPPPAGYIVQGTNVLAIQMHNASLGGSSDAFLDARLTRSSSAGAGPTPGGVNAVFDTSTPPHLRQVAHDPVRPLSGQPVRVTVKATDSDGVAGVTLSYQLVDPGNYIEIDDAEYETNWTDLPMADDGTGPDQIAGDSIWTAIMPGNLHTHRRLVRYRIAATDGGGATTEAPYADDPQPNFAYFVYDGVPGWSGAHEPGSSNATRRQVIDYGSDVMRSLPVYHLISKRSAVEDCTWFSRYGGSDYRWTGTLVYDGEVYDHINYRARGGVWRYAMGKNMWKFDFLRGHYFRARDDYGRRYDTRWDKLNFSAVIQQGNFLHRGEQGLFESTGFKLFNLMGVEGPKTSFVQFRIVDEASEEGVNQYRGDLWGLYLVIEQMDGRFLDEHGLPDGNLYKMEGGSGDLNNLGREGPTNKSDLNAFLNAYESGTQSEQWWRDNFELEKYYGYRSVVEGIHHYDIAYGKNYFYFRNPDTGRWAVHPWDLDLTWADNMFGSGNHIFKTIVANRAPFSIEYRNRIREFRDLLYNRDQMDAMIDEFAAMVDDPGGARSIVDVDRSMWDYNPIMINGSIVNTSKAGHGRFYERGTNRSFRGMTQTMKNYVSSRGAWIDSTIARDSEIPSKPTITYTGPAGFPIDRLTFRSGPFGDPQGANTFGAMKWRLSEITPPGASDFDPASPRRWEIEADWESGEIVTLRRDVVIPETVAKIGGVYRARVRMADDTGRWSHWSDPIEFMAGEPSSPFPQQLSLRITEVMYHPANGSEHEFVELRNVGASTLDLRGVAFTDGIEFDFSSGDVTTLAPGEYVLVVENLLAFESVHDTFDMNIAGQYRGRLDNSGERIELRYGANSIIHEFTYTDTWYPNTDGFGPSLTIVDELDGLDAWNTAAGWKESSTDIGTPGTGDDAGPVGGRQLPGDGNQDAILDVSDAVSLLRRLFVGGGTNPCEGAVNEGGNLELLDLNGDAGANVSDAIFLLEYLFKAGPTPVKGTDCIRIVGCPSVCR